MDVRTQNVQFKVNGPHVGLIIVSFSLTVRQTLLAWSWIGGKDEHLVLQCCNALPETFLLRSLLHRPVVLR